MTKQKSSSGLLYCVVCTKTSIQTGEKQTSRRGAYRSFKEADSYRREQEEALGDAGYEYEYNVRSFSPEDPSILL